MSDLAVLFHGDPALFAAATALLGLMVGSFLNVVIHRLPKMMEREWQAMCAELAQQPAPQEAPYSLITPRSHCPSCMHAIKAIENIPVLSFLLQRGKCRHCGAAISIRYPAVELLTAVISGYAAWHFGLGVAAAAAMLFCWFLIALAFIDADTQLLPDQLTLPLIWLGLLVNYTSMFTDLPSALIGAVAGYLVLWSVYWLFKLATGKEGMGYGDFKLLAAIGAWLGWQLLPVVILLSSLVGAVIGVSMIALTRLGRSQPIPFGPYLAGGGLIALFWGRDLTQAYLAWLN